MSHPDILLSNYRIIARGVITLSCKRCKDSLNDLFTEDGQGRCTNLLSGAFGPVATRLPSNQNASGSDSTEVGVPLN